MKIKSGYDEKPTEIRISVRDNGTIELWIEQTGLPENNNRETLSYMTAEELRELFTEVKQAGKDLFD